MNSSETDMYEKSYLETLEKPRKRRSTMFYVLILLGVAVVSFLIGYMILKITVRNRYAALIEEVKGHGEATEFSDIPIEELRYDQNAARFVKRAHDAYLYLQDTIDEDADEDYWWLAEDEYENYSLEALREHPDRIRIIRDYIKQNEKTIKLLQEGLRRPKANFHVDYESLDIPEICNLMNISKICWHHINLALLDNDFEQAIKHFIDMHRLALVMSNEHLLITRLVVLSHEKKALETLRFLYDNYEFTESQIEVIIQELGKFEYMKSLTDMLISERCFALHSYKNEELLDESFGFDYEKNLYGNYAIWLPDSCFDLDSLNYMKVLGQIIELTKKPIFEVKDEIFALQTEWDKETSIFLKSSSQSLPHSIYIVFENTKVTALNRIARTTLAVELFKLRQGKLPQTLSELVETGILKEMPVDPFTGKPMMYEVSGFDFCVFSKGFDEADNLYDSYENWELDGNLVWKYDNKYDEDYTYDEE